LLPGFPFFRFCIAPLRFGLVLMLGMSGLADAEGIRKTAPVEIEYGYPDQSIFMATKDASGRTNSPMIRLATALLDRAGLPWHAAAYPAPRLFSNLQNGTTNFSILVRSPALDACCLISRAPVYGTELNVYSVGDKAPIRQREDLAGRSVITIRGYSYGGMLAYIADPANHIRNETASTHRAAFDMLAAGRADYVLDYASAVDDRFAVRPPAGLRFDTLDRIEIYLILAKTYPDAEQVMARMEAIVRTLRIGDALKGRDKQ
jgi:ABC-type amino acid transport substrate-binding protein